MAGKPGFEPRLAESESAVLPLNYFPLMLVALPSATSLGRVQRQKGQVRFKKKF